MKYVRFIFLALFLVPLFVSAQDRVNDTVVRGVRYAMFTDSRGDVVAYRSAVLFDERQAVIDLNERLRNIAIYQSVAVPCAVAAPFALANAYSANPRYGMPGEKRYVCEHPALAAVGIGASLAAVTCAILTYVQLWTPRLYVNQDGLVFRLDGKKTKYYRHEFDKEDE